MKCILTFTFLTLLQAYGAEPRVTSKGANHRTWETVHEVTLPDGRTRIETNGYTELQGGLHRFTDQGWIQTDPKFEVSVLDGGRGVVNNLSYRASFAPNLAAPNAIDLSLPNGAGRVQAHLLGVSLTEGNQSVLIAEVKDCIGLIGGAEQNELTFLDAFEGASISVKYIAQRDRLSQILILEQQLPHPSQWGLTENAVLEVLTEFTTFPDLRKEPREPVNGIAGEHLSFASMEFVTGRAFSVGDEANSVLVQKNMELFEGQRWFLVEKIPWKLLAPELAKLRPLAKNWRKKEGQLVARNQLRLPKRDQARAALKPLGRDATPLASATPPKPAFWIDWELVASQNSFLWTNGTTFYIAGPISIKTNVFEPCVIKFAPTNSAKLTITGPVTCLSEIYAPIIMTHRDDRSVGQSIGTNTSISGYGANTAMDLDAAAAGGVFDLHDIRISHALVAVNFFTGRGHRIRNLQIVNADTAMSAYWSNFDILNGLFHGVQRVFSGAGSGNTTGSVQHVTFNQCSNLNSSTLTLYATNSLFVAVTNLTSFTGAFNGTNSDPSAALQIVGAGANYLSSNSPFRNAGTTNIEATLLSSLKQLTTYPPIVVGQAVPPTILSNTNLNLNPQAGRDTDTPDLGAHFGPLDFAFGGVYVVNSTITLNPGTAIALYSPTNSGSGYYGIALSDGAKIFSEGTASSPVRLVRYNTSQEQSQTTWNTVPQDHIASDWQGTTTTPEARFRFTEWSIPAADTYHFRGYHGTDLAAPFRDCQFIGGKFLTERPKVSVTNCLFNRVATEIQGFDHPISPTFQNCLFYGGTLLLDQEMGGTWTVQDTMFDRTTISQIGTITHDYNGYITNSTGQRLTPSASHDVATNTFIYETGALSRFYQSTNSPFLNVGSTNANLLGLFHFCVLTNNVKETNSIVDIGWHLVATTNGVPTDTDGDGLPDYVEDQDGDGFVDTNETSFTSADTDGDGVNDYLESLQGRNPLVSGAVSDSGNLIKLQIFTPLK